MGSREPPELPLDPPLNIAMHAPAPFTRLQSGFRHQGIVSNLGVDNFLNILVQG